MRFSRAGQYGGGLRADFAKEPVDVDFAKRLSEKLAAMDVSQTAAQPLPSLEAIAQLLGDDDGERRLIYLLSDFRSRQWDKPDELKERLTRLGENHAEIRLIGCVDTAHANLAITALEPEAGIRAAGVRWRMEVTVQNFGRVAARSVTVLLTEDGHARPPVTIADIPAGGVATQRFYVNFVDAGEHRIAARLEADAVAADNARYAVVDLPPEMPVLLVDGDPGGRDAKYLSWALTPGGRVRTGVRPRIETPRFLAVRPLDEFRAITVANVDRLDRSAIESLERYAAAGGGVAFFVGEQTRADFINKELYRDGKGLFPLPLAAPADLLVDRLEKIPDIQGEEHFLFRYLNNRNEHLRAVTVQRYFAAAKDWKPKADGSLRVIMRLRGGSPLLVEHSFGKGRVMAFLSTAAPVWNNWASNNETASFPVVVRELHAYLSRRPSTTASHQVGERLELKLDAAKYQPQVRFVTSSGDAASSATVDAVSASDGELVAQFSQTDTSGFCEARLTTTAGKPEVRYFAVNVDAAEGDLKALFGADLATRLLPEVKYQFEPAAKFQSNLGEPGGRNLSEFLLYLLIVLLIGEQVLAWSASYHPVSRASAPLARGVQASRPSELSDEWPVPQRTAEGGGP